MEREALSARCCGLGTVPHAHMTPVSSQSEDAWTGVLLVRPRRTEGSETCCPVPSKPRSAGVVVMLFSQAGA